MGARTRNRPRSTAVEKGRRSLPLVSQAHFDTDAFDLLARLVVSAAIPSQTWVSEGRSRADTELAVGSNPLGGCIQARARQSDNRAVSTDFDDGPSATLRNCLSPHTSFSTDRWSVAA